MSARRTISALLGRLPPRSLRAPSALRLRLTLWCLLVCAIALALLGALLLQQERAALLNGLDRQLTATAAGALSSARSSTHGSHPGGSQDCPTTSFGVVSSGRDTMTVVVCVARPDSQGRLRLKNGTAVPSKSPARAGCFSGGGGDICTWVLYDRHGRTIGRATAGALLDVIQPPLDEMRTYLLIALPIVLVLITAGGWLLIGRALAPIDRITRTAGVISAGNLSDRLGPSRSDDEVGRLVATLDQMLDRLEGAFAQQRAFTAAASHELRTPLTIVKSDLDILRRSHPIPPDEAEVLRGVDEEIARMGRVVEDLLTLARADSGQDEILYELVSLHGLVEAGMNDMERIAEEKGLSFKTELAGDIEVVGDATRLRQLVLNILTNAVSYTPAGGSIHVRLAKQRGKALLTVTDTGIGIAPEDLPHVFESFYRANKARSRAAGGAGLGLAIVQWCARAHGGSVEVESRPGVGSTFTVYLPLAPADDYPRELPAGSGHALPASLHAD